MSDTLSLFRAAEIASRRPPESIEDRSFRHGSNFACEQQERRRIRMNEAMHAFAPLFDHPSLPLHESLPIGEIAKRIRASEATVLRIVGKLGKLPEIKRRGHIAKRQPLRLTGPVLHGLHKWYRENRFGVVGPADVTKRRFL